MCGIAGAFGAARRIDRRTILAMLADLAHRGPDDEGVWNEADAWLGHRRLAILDLSPAGRQPMVSACGRYVIAFNGEIYNHHAIRRELEAAGHGPWRGRSDTEVLVEAVARLGIRGALERASGMFAMAVWDRVQRRLWLARDRFGKKPLYYAAGPGGMTFASELTSLERAGDLDLTLSADALALYFRHTYVPDPFTIYAGAAKLPPGSLLTWREGAEPTVEAYWTISRTIASAKADPLTGEAAAIDGLDAVLRRAVALRMEADVPLGCFLSGGVDSSLVAAMMQSQSDRPVKTFTLGFEGVEFDEAGYARAVARHLRTDHSEHHVTAADAQAVVPRLGAMFDEPFADASQIPTFLISAMARREATVCLTGDGGDEVFGGYVRYPGLPRLWALMGRLPLRGALARALEALPLGTLGALDGVLGPLGRRYTSRGAIGPSLRKLARWLPAASLDELYDLAQAAWADPGELVIGARALPPTWRPPEPTFDNEVETLMWRDTVGYLPGDILAKVDRASMASSLETRMPLLDADVAAFAWRLPASMKVRGGQTKWILRQVLDRYVPRGLIERPKMGFSAPLHSWLSGDLRDWAQSLLAPGRVARQGLLRPAPVAQAWERYLAGDTSLEHRVWSLLMFQAWLEARNERARATPAVPAPIVVQAVTAKAPASVQPAERTALEEEPAA